MAGEEWNRSLASLEQSKYALRMILLVREHPAATLGWLIRHIRTSPETVVRCARLLERSGLVQSHREEVGRRPKTYSLTGAGERLVTEAPEIWGRNPYGIRSGR